MHDIILPIISVFYKSTRVFALLCAFEWAMRDGPLWEKVWAALFVVAFFFQSRNWTFHDGVHT